MQLFLSSSLLAYFIWKSKKQNMNGRKENRKKYRERKSGTIPGIYTFFDSDPTFWSQKPVEKVTNRKAHNPRPDGWLGSSVGLGLPGCCRTPDNGDW